MFRNIIYSINTKNMKFKSIVPHIIEIITGKHSPEAKQSKKQVCPVIHFHMQLLDNSNLNMNIIYLN